MTKNSNFFDKPADFSLALGGPLFQLFLRTRLSGPALELLARRIIAITAIAWLPLLLLTTLAGQVVSGVQLPFFFALDTHVRFLVALPLLIAAELFVHEWSRSIIRQFLDRGLIAPDDRPRFDAIVASALYLRNSIGVELLLAGLAFAGHWLTLSLVSDVTAWYGVPVNGHLQYTPAGYWAAFISFPIFRFIALRWYLRIFIWYRFLWQVARLPLRLNTLHPDRAGGLGFLTQSLFAFAPVLLAHTIVMAGAIGNRIWQAGATLADFKLEIVGIIIFLLLIVVLPLTFFSAQVTYAKRKGLQEYGAVASGYVREFREKWIEGCNPEAERLLGSGDIQSLADLGNSFQVLRETSALPLGKEQVLFLAAALAAPFLPLLFTVIPLEEIIDRVVGMLL